jgi:GDP-fucose transporter C1
VLVIIGFLVGSEGEVNFSWAGVTFGVLSSVFIALHGVYVKKVLGAVENNEWTMAKYNTTMSIVIMIPLIFLSGEYEAILKYNPSNWSFVCYLVLLTGILGFSINIAVFLQIKYTSPLTSVIVGAAKSVLQTALSIVVFQNEISFVVIKSNK